MRKKKHFKINSKDANYDRFYMINYLEPGKDWKALEKERDEDEESYTSASESEVDETWDDWVEDVPEYTECLFCEKVVASPNVCMEHMVGDHAFDFKQLKKNLELDFYDCVKLINYVRRQMAEQSCVVCGQKGASRNEILQHMKQEGHFTIKRDAEFWKNPQYLIPTKENDNFLQGFDDLSDDDDDDAQDNLMPMSASYEEKEEEKKIALLMQGLQKQQLGEEKSGVFDDADE